MTLVRVRIPASPPFISPGFIHHFAPRRPSPNLCENRGDQQTERPRRRPCINTCPKAHPIHMTETRVAFDDGNAYDRYMGRWSRAIGERFLAWLDPPANLRWLDGGCGPGAFTKLVLDQTAPETMIGVDPS